VVVGETVRVGDALTKSRKSRADLGGAIVRAEVLNEDLAAGKKCNCVGNGRLANGEVVGGHIQERGVAMTEKRIV
jgi:hypothetical protein